MTDRPIIFSEPMVRALLDGRKTQTRRLLKLAGRSPDYCGPSGCQNDPTCWGWEDGENGDWITLEKDPGDRMGWRDWRGAHRAGDRLYVREHWSVHPTYNTIAPRYLVPGTPIYYRADCSWRTDGDIVVAPIGKHRQGMHMPRWASRLTLTVTDVRVQRVQEISERDARDEGVEPSGWEGSDVPNQCRIAFRDLWNSLHDKPGERWDDNPWIYALTFSVELGNIDR